MTPAPHQKVDAYSTHQRGQEDNRDTDARALLSCASRLKAVLDAGGADKDAYVQALRHNQRLWTIFQVSLCDPDNPLPRDLKITLLNLSRYVDRVSLRAIGSYAPQLLHSLIDINRMIAAGLSIKQKAGAQTAPPVETRPITGPAAIITTV
jgi:flagellar protein FlaF